MARRALPVRWARACPPSPTRLPRSILVLGVVPVALFERVSDAVSVYEVSLRDGLQNERATVPLRGKLRLIDALVQAGLRRIETTSFVSPKWIPQLADADEVAEHAKPPPGVTFSALCP